MPIGGLTPNKWVSMIMESDQINHIIARFILIV